MKLAEINRSPGNVKQIPTNPWKGSIGEDSKGHAVFEETADGCRCAIKNTAAKYRNGKTSISAIISDWAPVSDGNVPSEYINAVCLWTGFNDTQDLRLVAANGVIINYHYFLHLMRAIEHYEAGYLWVKESDWLDGLARYYHDFVEPTTPIAMGAPLRAAKSVETGIV